MAKRDAGDRFYSVWATAWGPMGAVMGECGMRRVVLPHYSFDDLLQLLAWEHPSATRNDQAFGELASFARDYFNGKPADFSIIPCDLPSPATLSGAVLRACRSIPYGRTRSYVALAESIGRPDAAQAVAAALGKNPVPLVAPCHRVTYADGRLGGFSAPGGVELKRRMLELERRAIGPIASGH